MTCVLVDVNTSVESLDSVRDLPDVRIETTQRYGKDKDGCLPSEVAKDTQILFCSLPPPNPSEMESLQLIQLTSSGYSQLFGLKLVEKGIRACNARGVYDAPIAEWNIAMMINLRRDLREMIRNQESGIWDRADRFQFEVQGSVVGIWGYGGIGRATARLAKALQMKVHVMSRNGVRPRENCYCVPGAGDTEGKLPDRIFVAGEEHDFLSGLDFLIMAMPLTKDSEGIVGEDELRALPPTSHLLNPARGPLIQEKALLRALDEGWIAGAALDAHYSYPTPADHPLWGYPNVIMTPHISGDFGNPNCIGRVLDLFTQNVQRFVSGKPLLNELTPDQLRGK